MRSWLVSTALMAVLAVPCLQSCLGQAGAMESGAVSAQAGGARAGETEEQHGRRLLEAMVQALGGEAWMDKGMVYEEGKTASFFHNQPNGSVIPFVEWVRPATAPEGAAERVEFLSVRGMIAPGMKRDVAHLWTKDNGYELTYKGRTELPKPQVEDYLRRRAHSIEEVMRTWVKAPGVMIVAGGTAMRDRHLVEKVSVLSANNDAVTIELDAGTHLPLQRSFEWRNTQFKDHDVDEETYEDYQAYDGVKTPLNVTRYRNGDMVGQVFLTKVKYKQTAGAELFDADRLVGKK